jgi:hypothetical protein
VLEKTEIPSLVMVSSHVPSSLHSSYNGCDSDPLFSFLLEKDDDSDVFRDELDASFKWDIESMYIPSSQAINGAISYDLMSERSPAPSSPYKQQALLSPIVCISASRSTVMMAAKAKIAKSTPKKVSFSDVTTVSIITTETDSTPKKRWLSDDTLSSEEEDVSTRR